MTATGKPTLVPPPAQGGIGIRPVKLLALVDGTEQTGRVLDFIKRLVENTAKVDVVLLNVQPRPADGRLRGYGSFKRNEIQDRLINDLGKRAIATAGKRLDQSRIAHVSRIEIGDDTATVLRVAKQEDCDAIVVGTSAAGPIGRWLTKTIGVCKGSIALRLAALADVPVLVVK